ncbi:C40 family peptidase [[Clostridium] spiroforme]|nr:C40 family peptidase [Thomasclavelia spiroformis]MBM6879709.1 C40 family peptidase [Thomasclavelia spiroformis]MBM6929985.1 C40 family peptidase [Thomasclavelia spiroformis]
MKKSLILSVCLTMLFTVQGSVKQTEAINFEGQEDKYMSLCSSSRLSNSNYSTCKQFNTYLKKKNSELQSSISSSKEDISQTQSTLDGVVAEIANLNNQIQQKQDEIDYLQTSIKNLEDSINRKEEEIRSRMYAMQSYNNSNSYVEYIFGASSFSDFFARVDSVNEITSYDEELIDEIADEKKQVEQQKQTVETAKANIESQKQQQEVLQTQYQDLLTKQQNELAAAQEKQEEISSTQSSLDSFLSSIIISNPSGGSNSSGGSSVTPPQNVPTTNKYGATVVAAAYSKLGCPYVWGASGPDTFDCSGLVMWCYRQAGVYLDHYSGSQKESGAVIPVSQAQPGDILWKSGHVGIYIGNGQYIHAPQTGDVVKIASNVGRFTCAVRPY